MLAYSLVIDTVINRYLFLLEIFLVLCRFIFSEFLVSTLSTLGISQDVPRVLEFGEV